MHDAISQFTFGYIETIESRIVAIQKTIERYDGKDRVPGNGKQIKLDREVALIMASLNKLHGLIEGYFDGVKHLSTTGSESWLKAKQLRNFSIKLDPVGFDANSITGLLAALLQQCEKCTSGIPENRVSATENETPIKISELADLDKVYIKKGGVFEFFSRFTNDPQIIIKKPESLFKGTIVKNSDEKQFKGKICFHHFARNHAFYRQQFAVDKKRPLLGKEELKSFKPGGNPKARSNYYPVSVVVDWLELHNTDDNSLVEELEITGVPLHNEVGTLCEPHTFLGSAQTSPAISQSSSKSTKTRVS